MKKKLCLLLAGGVFWMLLAGCAPLVKTYYSTQEIEAVLEEKYHIPFTVQERISSSRKNHERIYRVTSEQCPDVEFQVTDCWTQFSWSEGRDGVPPLPNFSKHMLRDNCRQVVWDEYAVPILEQYGLYPDGSDTSGYAIPYTADLEPFAQTLWELMTQLGGLPVFSTAEHTDSDYGVEVEIVVTEENALFVNQYLWLTAGNAYKQDDIRRDLEAVKTKAEEALVRRLEGMGISDLILEPLGVPVNGEDFFVIEELRAEMENCTSFVLDENWQGVLEFLRDISGWEALGVGTRLRYFGEYEINGTNFLCIMTSSTITYRHDNTAIMDYVLMADAQTGQLYQYGYGYGAVLVKSEYLLPEEAIRNLREAGERGEPPIEKYELQPIRKTA